MKLARISKPVYLDYAASTPIDPQVADVMAAQLRSSESFANASAATHTFGRQAAAIARAARMEVAEFMRTSPGNVIFTSGATEANNLAVLGTAAYRRHHGRHIVTSMTEHPAVLEPLAALEREGFDVTRLQPDSGGVVSPQDVEGALRPDTSLVALALVNNEIGVINPIPAIAAICKAADVRLHVDAAQAVGRVDVAAATLEASSISLSAHKFHGPKGVGALVTRAAIAPEIEPVQFGGGQEQGLRPGTLATHQVAGMAEAIRLCHEFAGGDERRHIQSLHDRLLAGLEAMAGCEVNGDRTRAVPGIVSITLTGVHGESLLAALEPLAVARGSACGSAHGAPSHVLRALGRSDEEAEQSLRLSFGRFTTEADIDSTLAAIEAALDYLRHIGGSQCANVAG